MKTLTFAAMLVLALGIVGAACADNPCCGQPAKVSCPQPCPVPQPEAKCCPTTAPSVCPSCSNPAWDRSPINVCPNLRTGAGPAVGQCVIADPWVSPCGAFCSSGQLAPGWPYGWQDEYWLRPNTNY